MQLHSLAATSILVADESSDTTCFVCFFTAATGVLEAKTGTNLTFNSSTGTLAPTNVELVTTTTSTTGVIFKGSDRFIHDFHDPTGGGALPVGRNTFVGVNAGNFTMGSTATETFHGSYNSAMGHEAFFTNTTGYHNSAIGYQALVRNTTGFRNSAMGYLALQANIGGSYNSAMGYQALVNNTEGVNNSAVGSFALRDNTEGDNNTAIGYAALINVNPTGVTEGRRNTAFGFGAGDNITTGSNNLIIGYQIDAPSATADFQLNIGDIIYGELDTGNVGIGTTSPDEKLVLENDTKVSLKLHGRGPDANSSIIFNEGPDGGTDAVEILYDGGANRVEIIDLIGAKTIITFERTGNVGIGVTDPDELLELFKAGTQLKLSGGAADYATFAVAADGALTITTVDADAAEGDILLMPDGNVGIGTTSPSTTLHVSGQTLLQTTGAADDTLQVKSKSVFSALVYTGTGGDDATVTGIFTGTESLDYVIEIDSGGVFETDDTFRWSDDGGGSWNVEGITITGNAQAMNNGLSVTFVDTEGHDTGDKWEFTATIYTGNLQEWQDVSGNNLTVVNESGEIEAGVDVHILGDNINVFWGAGDDWAAYYDGANMNFSGTGGLIIDTYLSVGNDNTPNANNIIRVRNDTGNASQKGCLFELDTTNAGGTYSQDAIFGNIRLFGAGALSDITAVRGVITARANASQTVENARIFEAQTDFGADGHDGDITVFANFYGGAIGTFTGDGSIITAYGLYLGDVTGGDTNYAIYTNAGDIRIGGDTYWEGDSAGLSYGSLYGNDIGFTVAGGTGSFSAVVDGDITTGQLHNVTHNSAGENTLDIGTYAGRYKVDWALSLQADGGAAKHIEGGIGVDADGTAGSLTIQNPGRQHIESVGTGENCMSGTAILDLAANAEVGLMVTNIDDNTNITVEHINLTIVQIGGT